MRVRVFWTKRIRMARSLIHIHFALLPAPLHSHEQVFIKECGHEPSFLIHSWRTSEGEIHHLRRAWHREWKQGGIYFVVPDFDKRLLHVRDVRSSTSLSHRRWTWRDQTCREHQASSMSESQPRHWLKCMKRGEAGNHIFPTNLE